VEINIEIKHVNGMSKPKVTIEDGTISYVLPFEVQLPPGQFDRICNLFRQRTPVQLTISSPQAKMDLFTEVVGEWKDTPKASYTETNADDLRQQARDALKTSESAERTAAESGDAGDREVADAAAQRAAEAISEASAACGMPENDLLAALGEEVHAEILAEGEMQAWSAAAEEGAAEIEAFTPEEREAIPLVDGEKPIIVDKNITPAELRRQIDEHAAEEEKQADAGDGAKPTKTRKAKQPA